MALREREAEHTEASLVAWYSIAIVKAALIIWILLVGIVAPPLQKHNAEPNAQENQEAVQGEQQPSTPIPSALATQKEATYNYQEPQLKKWDWHDAFAPPTWSNWALFLAGLAGIIAAIITLFTIRRQTDHIARQADISEAGMRQWIVTQNWRVRDKREFLDNPPLDMEMWVSLDFFNPTNYPLVVRGWNYTSGSLRGDEAKEFTLLPNIPYEVRIPVALRGREQVNQFIRDRAVITLVGEIRFIDVLGNRLKQPFGKLCQLGCDVEEFHRHEFIKETVENDDAAQERPN